MKNIKRHSVILFIFLLVIILYSCKQDDNRAFVVGKIHKASKLATCEFTISKIIHGTREKKIAWVIKLKDAQFIAYAKIIVKTGIDLQKLKKEDIEIEGKSISLMLPPVEVINFSFPPDSIVLDKHLTRNSVFNKIDLYDQEEFFRRAELDVRNNLEYMGIVEATQQKTRKTLMALLKTLNYEEIYINFKSDSLIIDKVPNI